jgi:hypothetical protein
MRLRTLSRLEDLLVVQNSEFFRMNSRFSCCFERKISRKGSSRVCLVCFFYYKAFLLASLSLGLRSLVGGFGFFSIF